MNWDQYQKRDNNKNLTLEAKFNDNVLLLKSYPGMKSELIEWAVEKYSGIVLEGTGLGHVSQNLLNAIKKGIEKGVLFCMTSQCIWGRINMNVYATGRDLLRLGVLPLKDMLPETALVKMMWTFRQTTELEDAKKIMITNIAGEISPRTLPEDVSQ
jgi:glutamyl-tRNA(Gln) amidotransferase subunit D